MRRIALLLALLFAAPAAHATDTQAVAFNRLGKVLSNHGFVGQELTLVLSGLYGKPRLYDTAAHLTADATQADGTFGYAANTHALYVFSNSSWSQLFPAPSFSSGLTVPSILITSNTGVDRSTAAALILGGTNATSVQSVPVLQLAGGLDTTSATSLAIGAANATSVVVTPPATVTGVINANGGVDRSSAAALAIGATNATSVNIGATATAVAVTAAGAVSIPSTLGVTGLTTTTGGLVKPANTDTGTGSVLTTATSGGLFVANAASDAVTTWTLPAASTKASYCFSQGASSLGSNREVDVATPSGSDLIIATTNPAGATGIATTPGASHGVKNTHASAVRGNMICLAADGVNTWYETAETGTWAGF